MVDTVDTDGYSEQGVDGNGNGYLEQGVDTKGENSTDEGDGDNSVENDGESKSKKEVTPKCSLVDGFPMIARLLQTKFKLKHFGKTKLKHFDEKEDNEECEKEDSEEYKKENSEDCVYVTNDTHCYLRIKDQVFCDVCSCNLTDNSWFHKKNCDYDLCISHWGKLPRKSKDKFIFIKRLDVAENELHEVIAMRMGNSEDRNLIETSKNIPTFFATKLHEDQLFCGICGCNLIDNSWYHKKNCDYNLCISHWDKLPRESKDKFIFIKSVDVADNFLQEVFALHRGNSEDRNLIENSKNIENSEQEVFALHRGNSEDRNLIENSKNIENSEHKIHELIPTLFAVELHELIPSLFTVELVILLLISHSLYNSQTSLFLEKKINSIMEAISKSVEYYTIYITARIPFSATANSGEDIVSCLTHHIPTSFSETVNLSECMISCLTNYISTFSEETPYIMTILLGLTMFTKSIFLV